MQGRTIGGMAKSRRIARPRNAATNHRTRRTLTGQDRVRRTVKNFKKRWGL
jgi:hypothetical protein